jgi:hypothetical protein
MAGPGLFTDDVAALRALQNPALFTSEHYKQAAIAVAAGIAIRLAISIPVRHAELRYLLRKLTDRVDPWNQGPALVPFFYIQFRTCDMG